ncbi:hypothetical protein Vretifemale_2019, partial [Volvox reticuliferus]
KRGMHEQGMAQQSEPAKRPRWPLSSHGLSAGDCQTSTFKFGVVSGCTSSTHPDEGPGNAAVSSCAAGNTTADNNEPGDVLHVATSPPGRLTRGMARELAHARGHSSMDNGLQEKAHATGAAAPGGQRWTRGYCKKYRARTVGPAAADMPVATAEAEAAPEDSLGSSALKKADDYQEIRSAAFQVGSLDEIPAALDSRGVAVLKVSAQHLTEEEVKHAYAFAKGGYVIFQGEAVDEEGN